MTEAQRIPGVLLALDATESARAALPVARALAEIEGAALHIVHAAPGHVPPAELLGRLGLDPAEVGRAILHPVGEPPAAGIVGLAREWRSPAIVLCPRTELREPRGPGPLGHVALEVLLTAPCPVVLVPPRRGRAAWRLREILLPHDGTPSAAQAFGCAADLSARAGARLHVLHVTDRGGRRAEEKGTFAAPRYLDQPQHEWPAWAREFMDRLASGSPLEPARVRLALAHGAPAAEIVHFAAAAGVDLIVLAWKGALEPERAETVKAVIRDAPAPVLVLRTGGSR
jgi:nucleotide-binding universal stress UspA family protein